MTDLATFDQAQAPIANPAGRAATARRSEHVAPDCRGLNFYDLDRSLRDLLPLYMAAPVLRHFAPHYHRLGELAGGRLGDLAQAAERHPPELHPRDRFGRDEEWIEFHPAYREMEQIAFGDFGIHAMSNRPGVLGWPEVVPPIVKFTFQYLFTQAEFGLLCPINLTDHTAHLVARHATPEIRARYLDGLLSQDMTQLLRGAQFMTEKAGGSDVGSSDLTAVREGDHWRLWGEKWFCSNADAEVALVLARPEGAPAGSRGLGLFLVPRLHPDGSRNDYRVVRLKDKLGSRSMASGEIVFEGASAHALGALDRGLKQMLEMVNLSRLSHGFRAAGMMRRCLNEALQAVRHRRAFGAAVVDQPLMRRQLMKMMVASEQALSAALHTAWVAGRVEQDPQAERRLRILTPIVKFRACRDNVTVATGALEARGGNGYIEDWINPKLVRDAHLGLIWEGTSNIASLDALRRAVGREKAHEPLHDDLAERIAGAKALPGQFRTRLESALAQTMRFAAEVAAKPEHEGLSRQAASLLYHVTTAVLLAGEGVSLGEGGGDARRLLLARFVLEHHLSPREPFSLAAQGFEAAASQLLLEDAPVPLERAADLVLA